MGNIVPSKGRARLKDFVSWFEIPVYDVQRAAAFYNTIYQMDMELNVNGDFAMAFFPADRGIGGALVAGPGCTPSATGPLIYLNAGSDLDAVLARVHGAGGRVIMARSMISESAGSFALILDSEGNRLALHEGPTRTMVEPPKAAPKAATKTGAKAAPKASPTAATVAAKKPAPGKKKNKSGKKSR